MGVQIDRVAHGPVVEREPEVGGGAARDAFHRERAPEPAQAPFRHPADLVRNEFATVRPAEMKLHASMDTGPRPDGKNDLRWWAPA